jgi:hypothetical protein
VFALAGAVSSEASGSSRHRASGGDKLARLPLVERLWADELRSRRQPVLRLVATPGLVPAAYYRTLTPLLVVYPNGLGLLRSTDDSWGFRVTIFTPKIMERISNRLRALGVDHVLKNERVFGSSGIMDGSGFWIELRFRGRTQSVALERLVGPIARRGSFGIDADQASRRHRLFALFGELQRPMAAFGSVRPRFRESDTVTLTAEALEAGSTVKTTGAWPSTMRAPSLVHPHGCITVASTTVKSLPLLAAWRFPNGRKAYVAGRPDYPHERTCTDVISYG